MPSWMSISPISKKPPKGGLSCWPDHARTILLAWWSFGNFLMTAKRLSEFRLLRDKAADYRLSHKRYSRNLLLFGMVASAAVFLTTFLVFVLSLRLYRILILFPLLFLYLFLFFRKTLNEKEVMEEPESLLSNPLIALLTLVLAGLFALSVFL